MKDGFEIIKYSLVTVVWFSSWYHFTSCFYLPNSLFNSITSDIKISNKKKNHNSFVCIWETKLAQGYAKPYKSF